MCAVSNMGDWGRQQWWPNYPYTPLPIAVPDPVLWKKYMDLVEAAKKFDTDTKQPECEDPEKTAWFKEMEKRVAELEKKVAKY
jgi:hypothetical protein